MLSEIEIKSIGRTRRLTPWQEEKRYIQSLTLYSLSEHAIIAKGGTYLWFFHGLNRFSEDLDFTAEKELIAEVADEVSKTLQLFGVQNKPDILKDDRYTLTFRIAARGPLFHDAKDTCYVNVEVSRREKNLRKPITVRLDEPFYNIPIVYIRGMELCEVLSEKVRAIMTRGNARDLYDAWYLISRRKIHLDRQLTDAKLSFYGGTLDKDELNAIIERIGRSWEKELRPIVIGTIPDFEEVKAGVSTMIDR